MVGSRQAMVKRTATKKGLYAAGAGTLTVLSIIFAPWFLTVVGVGATGYFTYDWLKYRGKWGLRF